MTEEEFEERLGIQYGWGRPMGFPSWPFMIPAAAWLAIICGLVWLGYHFFSWALA